MNNQLSLKKEKALLIEQFSKNQKEFYKEFSECLDSKAYGNS